jgi:hypothetical protein
MHGGKASDGVGVKFVEEVGGGVLSMVVCKEKNIRSGGISWLRRPSIHLNDCSMEPGGPGRKGQRQTCIQLSSERQQQCGGCGAVVGSCVEAGAAAAATAHNPLHTSQSKQGVLLLDRTTKVRWDNNNIKIAPSPGSLVARRRLGD